MNLTRVKLNSEKRETQMAFSIPNRFHGAIERSFSDRQKRNLWRIDKLNGCYYLLLLSEEVPDMSGFVDQFGDETATVETKVYDSFLERVTDNSEWHFRLVANPTHSLKSREGRGKIVAHITPEHQLNWLKSKAEQNGFIIDRDCVVSSNEWRNFKKSRLEKGRVSLLVVSFEGILKVRNSDVFKQALVHGIGRGKAYGCGMLTISKIR